MNRPGYVDGSTTPPDNHELPGLYAKPARKTEAILLRETDKVSLPLFYPARKMPLIFPF
jgi:hypothetical protein